MPCDNTSGVSAVLGSIQDGARIFDNLRFTTGSCEEVNSLNDLKELAGMKKLAQIFNANGFKAEIGFNRGTRKMFLTFPIPSDEDMLAGIDSVPRQILLLMLALHPHQQGMEECARKLDDFDGTKLANKCLEYFMKQTGVAVLERVLSISRRTLQVSFEPANKGLKDTRLSEAYTDSKKRIFWYSQSYTRLRGRQDGVDEYSDGIAEEEQKNLLDEMLSKFWEYMENERYFADDSLMKAVSTKFREYLKSGLLNGLGVQFTPLRETISFYLHGIPGIGKSAFVKAYRYSLEKLIQVYVNPKQAVTLVKLPLNSLSEDGLRSELLVKGISDWSIERIIEQAVVKGTLVVLHLEEPPEDHEVQAAFFAQIKKMMGVLAARYPAATSGVMHLYTANYEAAPAVAAEAVLVELPHPTRERQKKWVTVTLANMVSVSLQGAKVQAVVDVDLPETRDMRPLDRWNNSVGFLIGEYLNEKVAVETKGLECSVKVSGKPDELAIAFDMGSEVKVPDLTLCSEDSFVFYRKDKGEEVGVMTECGVPLHQHPYLDVAVSMVVENALKPGVVVLKGTSEATGNYVNGIRKHYESKVGEGKLHEKVASLYDDADKEVIMGAQNEMRGGLFKFIDDVNSVGGEERRDFKQEYALIVLSVNETGQYMLREMLENNSSETHRQKVRKDGILFVLVLDKDTIVTETLESRAHQILMC